VDKRVRNSLTAELERMWEQVLERMAARVEADDLARLIRPLRPVALTPAEFRLEAPSKIVLLCVQENYLDWMRECVTGVMGPRQVAIQLPELAQGELFHDIARRRSERRGRLVFSKLNPKYTFTSFVVGASNQFAHAASKAVAAQPGSHYNPLFIYGGVGLGKTHLVNAIGHHICERHPSARVACLSSGAFTNDLIASLRRDRMDDFKERFRQVDVLILDDVQLLAGRERTQEEFFHTFNTLYDQRHQIILTSDKVPKDIAGLEERLRNRFEWGLIADIQPPDIETRVAIIEKKAELEGIPLPTDVALFLGGHLSSNVRELEGFLTRLGAYASIGRRVITIEFAREVLQQFLKPKEPKISYEAITDAVCAHYSLRPSDLRSKRRSHNVALPRQVAMYLCRQLLSLSFPQVGQRFGRDHSTVIHANTVVQRRLKEDPAFQATVEGLERSIRGQ
jgi:chromosomal replication initiator protein